MEKTTLAKLMALVVIIAVFAIGATQGELIELALAFGAATAASLIWWGFYPPTDLGDRPKLKKHLLLSWPLAGIAVVSGAVVLYDGATVDVPKWLALAFLLTVPAAELEKRLMETES